MEEVVSVVVVLYWLQSIKNYGGRGDGENAYVGLIKSRRWPYVAHLGRSVLWRFLRGIFWVDR